MNDILEMLNQKQIHYKLIHHKRVYTIDEIKAVQLDKEGIIPKNIFLRNANGKTHYLIICHPDKKIDMKALASKLHSSRLSFASDQRLQKYLNVEKGSVSPLGFLYDQNHEVIFVFDQELVDQTIGVHPNYNDTTLFLACDDLIRLIENHNNQVLTIQL